MALQSKWTDPDTTIERLTVAILFPSGVRSSYNESLQVLDGAREFEIKVNFPKIFCVMTKLHKKWMYCSPTTAILDKFSKSHFKGLDLSFS